MSRIWPAWLGSQVGTLQALSETMQEKCCRKCTALLLAIGVGESHRHSNKYQKILVKWKNERKRANMPYITVPKTGCTGKLEHWERSEPQPAWGLLLPSGDEALLRAVWLTHAFGEIPGNLGLRLQDACRTFTGVYPLVLMSAGEWRKQTWEQGRLELWSSCNSSGVTMALWSWPQLRLEGRILHPPITAACSQEGGCIGQGIWWRPSGRSGSWKEFQPWALSSQPFQQLRGMRASVLKERSQRRATVSTASSALWGFALSVLRPLACRLVEGRPSTQGPEPIKTERWWKPAVEGHRMTRAEHPRGTSKA